jgi:hypothetical protein
LIFSRINQFVIVLDNLGGTFIVTFLPELNYIPMKSLVIIASLSLLMGCSTTKKTTQSDSAMENSAEIKEMTAQGYLMGTVKVYASEGNCPYVIEVADDTPYYLDPINLEESFKQEGTKIWFTFAGLRMMNRCIKANPVSILDIKKRAE